MRCAKVILVATTLAGGRALAAGPVDFTRDVKPIFELACLSCHDAKSHKGDLRLDDRKEALETGGLSGVVIVPGKSGESLLLTRVKGEKGESRMPPDGKGHPLSAAQIDILRRWVDEGAVWPAAPVATADGAGKAVHWAYVAPRRSDVPTVKAASWVRTPIDAFIAARLEKEGLSPSPEAPRETWLRRVTLDLTGLPPTPAEVDAFVKDRSAKAHDAVVTRLLSSQHYGERWARPWLDLARYADSNGYEKDRIRVAWKYRDWVIDALNANMPFDKFTIEQIAGDMLPNPTVAQRVATGFHRNTLLNQEGGIDVEEARWETLIDRVGTTATTWLGSTIACAQCHNHKYDPFSQKDFFRLLAFFDNGSYGVGDASGDKFISEPDLSLPSSDQKAMRDRLQGEIAALERRLQVDTPAARAAMARWEDDVRRAEKDWTVAPIQSATSKGGAVLRLEKDGGVLATGANPEADTYDIEATTTATTVSAIRLEVLAHPSLPAGGPGRSRDGNFFLSGFDVRVASMGDESGGTPVKSQAALADDHVSTSNVHNLLRDAADRPDGWSVDVAQTPRPARRQAIFVFDKPVRAPDGAAGLRFIVRMSHAMPRTTRNIGRFRLSVANAAEPLLAAMVPTKLHAAFALPMEKRAAADQSALAAIYMNKASALEPVRRRIAELRREMDELRIPSALVLIERPSFERPSTHLRVRGNFLDKGELLYAGTPKALSAMPESAPANRLGLARWLVSPDNPLTARVTVNRIWESYFGRGLVETTEDFGTQGARPSHPELLDWLATELVRTGWDLKALHRLITSSAVYRQSSAVTPALLERDPYNVLLARGPRFRLEAEAVRDVALAASGLLSKKVGGPSVFPAQPEGVWNIPYSKDKWTASTGEDAHRRGLYTFMRRSAPYPSMLTFDAPSRESCTARRIRTNTPLQALTTMNDPVFFEAAQALARRIEKEAADAKARATLAFKLCTARTPKPDELNALLAFQSSERARFARDPAAATKLTASASPSADRAAWTVVANVLLNLDETITKE